MIKHSVAIISFNQETLIKEAIDSLLHQTELPYEIIISDDCSTDNTWKVITEYYDANPNLIIPIRNEKNLGIFGNLNSVLKMVKGDVISLLAGDDYFMPSTIEVVNNAIRVNNLDIDNDAFIIITNTLHLNPDGSTWLFDNYVLRERNLIKERLRYNLSFREIGLGKNVLKKMEPIKEDFGHYADFIFGFDQIVCAEKFIFINETTGIYRLGTGVTARKNLKSAESKFNALEIIKHKYKKYFDRSDFLYIKYEQAKLKYSISNTPINYLKASFLFLANINNFRERNSISINSRILIPIFIKKIGKYLLNKP